MGFFQRTGLAATPVDTGIRPSGASQYSKTVCQNLTELVPGREAKQSCDPDMNIAMCEMGDLAGKMGKVKIETGVQKFSDRYISNLENIADRSIVFHCGSPRVACGNFFKVM